MKPGKTFVVAEQNLKRIACEFYAAEAEFARSGGKGLSTNYRKNLELLGDAAAVYAQAVGNLEDS